MTGFRLDDPTVKREVVLGVVPRINVTFAWLIEGHEGGSPIVIASAAAEGDMAGVPMEIVGVRGGEPMLYQTSGTTNGRGDGLFQVLLRPEFIRKVDEARKGDLASMVNFRMTALWLATDPRTNSVLLRQSGINFQINLAHSRDQWTDLLAKIGHNPTWVVEVPSPGTVQWPEVEKHLRRAEDEMRAHQSQAAAQACRDAWQAAQPFLEDRWEDIDEVLRRRSKQLGKYPPLPERVATTYDDVSRLLNDSRTIADTSKHGEAHTLSDDDALLIYRLTHALLAYLARQAALAKGTKAG